MTFKQTLLRHWWKIIGSTIAAPLTLAFGFVSADQEVQGVPVKYGFLVVGALGLYTLSLVRQAIAMMGKGKPNPKEVKPVSQELDDAGMFEGFKNSGGA